VGAEFIRKATKTLTKHWDNARTRLGTADLFTRDLDCATRSAPFDLSQSAALSVGDAVTVEKEGGALVARQRLSEVARTDNPPAELLRAVEHSCGIAKGTIEQIHGSARVAEISLC
jgi:hypothetical protein